MGYNWGMNFENLDRPHVLLGEHNPIQIERVTGIIQIILPKVLIRNVVTLSEAEEYFQALQSFKDQNPKKPKLIGCILVKNGLQSVRSSITTMLKPNSGSIIAGFAKQYDIKTPTIVYTQGRLNGMDNVDIAVDSFSTNFTSDLSDAVTSLFIPRHVEIEGYSHVNP
jgi:hypothetical protein